MMPTVSIIQKRKEYKKRQSTAKKQVMKCVNETLKTRPFITMAQLAALLRDKCNVTLSERTIGRYSKEAGFTYKKATAVVHHKHDNNQVKSFCEQFISAYNAGVLYCIDEAGFYVGDHPRKGWAKKGQRLAVGTGKTIRKSKFSLGMAIGVDGVVGAEIMTHNYKKPDFVRFFTNIPLPHGSVILMDNLKAHHSKEVKEVFNKKGYIALYTPPYSPRCNPIEKVFGKFKLEYRSRCIELTSLRKDDFRDLFLKIIEQHYTASFDTTFQNTLSFLNETLHNIAIDPNFRFIGYDISSFVQMYKDNLNLENVSAQPTETAT
jgi:transposase